jgi:hypothetical protein
LDQTAAAAEIENETRVFAVSIDLSGLGIGGSVSGSEAGAALTREDLEKIAIEEVVRKRPLLGLDDREEELCALLYELKELVRRAASGIELAERIERSRLVDLVEMGKPVEKQDAFTVDATEQSL